MASILGRVVLLLMAVMTGTVPVRAAPIIGLASSSDLTQLSVGDQIHVDVTLGGVSLNELIFVLNTRELFPSSLFQVIADPGNSSGLSPGPILSVASQRDSFNALSSITVSSVIGNFSDSMPTPSQAIAGNGLFYSFALRAIAPGSGVIQFNPAGTVYASNLSGFNLAPLPTSGPLTVSVAAVPEPTSAVMLGVGTLAVLAWVLRRRAVDGRTFT
jgi:hypothetical protein